MLCYLPIAQSLVPAQNHALPFLGPYPPHIEFHHTDTWVFQRSRTHQKDWILGNEIAHSIHLHLQDFIILKIAFCLILYIYICVCVCVCKQNTKWIAEMQYRNIKSTETQSGT